MLTMFAIILTIEYVRKSRKARELKAKSLQLRRIDAQ